MADLSQRAERVRALNMNCVHIVARTRLCQARRVRKAKARGDGYHHGDLPRALVATAIRVVRRVGVEGFSLREAAREAGVAPSAVYNHFDDKAALLTAVAEDGFAKLGRAMKAAREGETAPGPPGAAARLRALGEAYVRFALGNPEQFRLMFGVERRARGAIPPGSGPGPFDQLLSVAAELAPPDPLSVAVPAWCAVHGLASLLLDGAMGDGDAEATIALVLDAVTSSKGVG
jgi:AcrR family transcriptional regulator